MYLVDTNVVSEARRKKKANKGVRQFFRAAQQCGSPVFISAITVGELRRGVELLRHRGDKEQGDSLEKWLQTIVTDYANLILPIDQDVAQVWGKLRVPHHEHALDKQIAATALIHQLTLVTRNVSDFKETGVDLLNPFTNDH